MDSKLSGVIQVQHLLNQDEQSMGHEDSYAMGYVEGQKSAEFQRKLLADALKGLIQIASSHSEFNSLAYARYLLKKLGYK